MQGENLKTSLRCCSRQQEILQANNNTNFVGRVDDGILHAKYSFPSISEARKDTRIGSPARQVCSDVGSALVPISENGSQRIHCSRRHGTTLCTCMQYSSTPRNVFSKSTNSWTGVTITFLQLKNQAAAVCIYLESN